MHQSWFFKGLNVVAVPRLRDVGGRERKWNISGSPPVYQAQLKWIKPGWPIRHKLNFLHDSITYPTLPPFLTTALQTSIPVQDWPHHKLTGSQYMRKYCCNPDTWLQRRLRWSQKKPRPSETAWARLDQNPVAGKLARRGSNAGAPGWRWLHMTPAVGLQLPLPQPKHTIVEHWQCLSTNLLLLLRPGNCPDHRTWGQQGRAWSDSCRS